MDSTSLELSLNVRRTYIPKTMSTFLNRLSEIKDTEKLSEVKKFRQELEQETVKIAALLHHAPVCMLLLRDAIKSLEEEEKTIMKNHLKSESSRHATTEVLKEEWATKMKKCIESEPQWLGINALKEKASMINKSRSDSESLRCDIECLKEEKAMVLKKQMESESQFRRDLTKKPMLSQKAALTEESMIMEKGMGFESQWRVSKDFLHLPVKRSCEQDHSTILERGSRLWNNSMNFSQLLSSHRKGKKPTQITEPGTEHVYQPWKINDGIGAFKPYKSDSAFLVVEGKGKQIVEGLSQPFPPPPTETPRAQTGLWQLRSNGWS